MNPYVFINLYVFIQKMDFLMLLNSLVLGQDLYVINFLINYNNLNHILIIYFFYLIISYILHFYQLFNDMYVLLLDLNPLITYVQQYQNQTYQILYHMVFYMLNNY